MTIRKDAEHPIHDTSQNQEPDLTVFEEWLKEFYGIFFPEVPIQQIEEHFKSELPPRYQDSLRRFWEMSTQLREMFGEDFLKRITPKKS